MSTEGFNSSEPDRPILTDDVLHEIDCRAIFATQNLAETLIIYGGIEPLVERYTPFKLPERIHRDIYSILRLPDDDRSNINYDDDKRVLRDGLIAGFILGRRLIKRTQYPGMTTYQHGVLQDLRRATSRPGIDVDDYIYPGNRFADKILSKLENSEIHDLSYPCGNDVFRKETFMRASSYLGGSAMSYLVAKLTRNIDFETEAYFSANANKLARDIKEESAGRKKLTPLTHLIRGK